MLPVTGEQWLLNGGAVVAEAVVAGALSLSLPLFGRRQLELKSDVDFKFWFLGFFFLLPKRRRFGSFDKLCGKISGKGSLSQIYNLR